MADQPDLADLVPEGALPTAWVRAVAYLDTDGEERFSIDWMEGTSTLVHLGLMDRAKAEFLRVLDG